MRVSRIVLVGLAVIIVFSAQTAVGEMAERFAVSPQVGLVYPIQYLKETDGGGSADIGFTAGATIEYSINKSFAVGGRFIYNRFGLNTDDLETASPSATFDGKWTIVELGAYVRYLPYPDRPTRPYGRGGLLLGMAETELEVTQDNSTVTKAYDIDPVPGFEIAGGVIHDVAENISLFAEAGWSVVATDGANADLSIDSREYTVEMEKHLQWIGVKVGAMFFFGAQ